jgi:hypothetical protein
LGAWDEAIQRAGEAWKESVDELKTLPIAYVLERNGVSVESEGNGAYKACCPFHDDGEPSFNIYGEKLERWGCFPCGISGDVLDLVGRIYKTTSFHDTKAKTGELSLQLQAEEWQGPTVGVRKTLDINAVRLRVHNAQLQHTGMISEFLQEHSKRNPGLAMDEEWLREMFDIGEDSDRIIIPYKTATGALATCKHRALGAKAISTAGSDFTDLLYGLWYDDPKKTVLLCEGESDVWAAQYAVGDTYAVLGLPTGAGAHAKQAAMLSDRTVILAFDGDTAGRKASRKWAKALIEVGCVVRILPMPDGYDLAKFSTDQIKHAVARARVMPPALPGLYVSDNGYYRLNGETRVDLSNWVFLPQRELAGSDGYAYEGVFMPHGEITTVSSHDLSGQVHLKAWSRKLGGAWAGSDQDVSRVLSMLQAEGPFLAPGNMTSVAGLSDDHFVAPGLCIGTDHWVYVPPRNDPHFGPHIRIVPHGPDNWTPLQVGVLRELHCHEVMDPILAWLAVAPVRSLLNEFPILAVTGSSGTGKTTLIDTVVPAFLGSSISINLTSTTRHALDAFVSGTNAWPVHVDEFRPGARLDTMTSFRQIIRDAYTAQENARGGMTENFSEITTTAAVAPIIVSGEDSFEETSHTERMVSVALPLRGRNPEVLAQVRAWPAGFASAYLTWMQKKLEDGTILQIVNYKRGDPSLPDRHQINLGLLDLGWEILNQFLRDHNCAELENPAFTLVSAEAMDASQHNPIKDAIQWALDEPKAISFMWEEDDKILIRVPNLVKFLNDQGGFHLPGGAKAVAKYMEQHYGAEIRRVYYMGKQVRALSMDSRHFSR